ncbi:MAG: DUF3187 family protein [Pseudomonadota bacterium]
MPGKRLRISVTVMGALLPGVIAAQTDGSERALITGDELVAAAVSEPLYVKNLSPIVGLTGLPSQRSAMTTAPSTVYAALHTSVANNYVLDSDSDELVNLDGETLRFALELRYGLARNWDLQLEVPWLDNSGGHLDKLIDDWHEFWGMSDGGRDQAPRDVIDFRYQTLDYGFGLQEDASGIGDISLSLNHTFYRDEGSAATAVLGYKFGTGDAQDFTGSGEDDAFLAIRLSGEQMSDLPLSWHGQVGYLRAGKVDLLGERQQRDFWFAGISMDWHFARRWSAIVQVDSHSAPLDSDLKATGEDAFMLTVGGRWRFAQDWSVDASVIEDIETETAPDVTFQLSLRYSPR